MDAERDAGIRRALRAFLHTVKHCTWLDVAATHRDLPHWQGWVLCGRSDKQTSLQSGHATYCI
jgi:hypothetical protein